jgi:hypothetical protein
VQSNTKKEEENEKKRKRKKRKKGKIEDNNVLRRAISCGPIPHFKPRPTLVMTE